MYSNNMNVNTPPLTVTLIKPLELPKQLTFTSESSIVSGNG